MPDWNEVLIEIQNYPKPNALDQIRHKYLKSLAEKTNRNVIAYYSGWLQNPGISNTSINDIDKNAFMATIRDLDRSKGLDLILHTPGGDTAATESLVDYLRQMFGIDIRVIVPQLAMSAGTMIACASKEIIMGKQSSLGPIDPQFGGIPAHGVIEEFRTAIQEVEMNPSSIPIWQVIIGKYHPTFIGECEKAITMSSQMVKKWLETGMFNGEYGASEKIHRILSALNNHEDTKTHARHIPVAECEEIGLKVMRMEEDDELQDLILTVHHTYMHTFSQTKAFKIVENNIGKSMIEEYTD